jgi:hypothetical protein
MKSVGTQRGTFSDASGRVNVAVFAHQCSPAQAHWNEEEILVGDPDMIAIGGGGTGTDIPAGNLLTSSHPNDDLSGWVVSSKDHEVPNPVELAIYVIGLKIVGMSKQDLLRSVYIGQADSGVVAHPEAEAGVPSDEFVLLGGGFRVDWHGAGNLATASFPSTLSSWKARSKDHDVPDPSNLHVFAIGLRRNLPVGTINLTIERADSGQAPHPAAVATMVPGFALTGGGAEVHYNGSGSLLWKLEPSTSASPIFSAASKDHLHPDPSTLTTYALGISIAPPAEMPPQRTEPVFPIAASRDDNFPGSGGFMHTDVTVSESGALNAVTHIWEVTELRGFVGAVAVVLTDTNKTPLWVSPTQKYGVEGRMTGTSDRTENWTANVPAALLQQARGVAIVQRWDPRNVFDDIQAWLGGTAGAVHEVASIVTDVATIIKAL